VGHMNESVIAWVILHHIHLLNTSVCPLLTFALVDSRDLERYGGYHVASRLSQDLSLITSIGLARECQGSTFRTRSPGLLYGGAHPRVNDFQFKRLDNY